MSSRRSFIGTVASGLATTIAAPNTVLGANDRVRLGIIGPGDRGIQLVREALSQPGVEFVAFSDIYSRRLEDAKKLVLNAATYYDYRRLLDDKSIDAVLIATPQHLHCEHFVAALDAGKHVYQEKTMAFTVDHAKRMRAAYNKAGKRIVQIGHQACSSGHVPDANSFASPERLGKITALHMHMYRNTPHGKPQWSRPVYPDMTPENILWNAFQGEAPKHEFDANRYVNWRFYWDYSGGNFYENMCHQIAFWYKVLNLQIPTSVVANGGVYLWKDGREVPDTMSVSMVQPEEMLITWNSGFGNAALGTTEDVLGTDGTISRGQQIRYAPQNVNRPDATELVGQARSAPAGHIANFIESIRGASTPNCPFELGYRVSIACRMAVESYLHGRSVTWDAQKEQIV
jgi:predicted dehydrogenase